MKINYIQYFVEGECEEKLTNTLKNEIKSEAIKEFVERLKEIIYIHMDRVDVDGIVLLTRIDNGIDNLVEEMREENNEY